VAAIAKTHLHTHPDTHPHAYIHTAELGCNTKKKKKFAVIDKLFVELKTQISDPQIKRAE